MSEYCHSRGNGEPCLLLDKSKPFIPENPRIKFYHAILGINGLGVHYKHIFFAVLIQYGWSYLKTAQDAFLLHRVGYSLLLEAKNVQDIALFQILIRIAFKNNISLQTLLEANGLSQACPLFVGQQITVPQPTYTPTSLPTNTLEPDALTATARPRATYTVAAGDTLFSIAAFYNVDYRAVAEENGIPGPDYSISIGQVLVIPLDRPVPTAGPSPTATALPPYPAPVLLSPPDGAAISAVEQTVVLQWAAVDVLQQSEAYLITVEDLTCNCAKRKVDVTTTTRYIVNVDLKPAEAQPHVFKWTVVTVRQTGTTDTGKPIYEPAGATSAERAFSWTGIGVVAATATLAP